MVAGLSWIPWRKAQRELAADARAFVRSAPRGSSRGRLAELRAELACEFDAVAERRAVGPTAASL